MPPKAPRSRWRRAASTESKSAAGKIGGGASFHAADVTDPAAALALVSEIEKQSGRIDILVCNVGSGASVPPGKETAAEWSRVMDLNLFATTNMIEAARPLMSRGNGDRAIVCVSSICGLAALGAPVTYSAAKAALNATVRGLARPLALEGIRINAVAPGNILFDDGTWARKIAENKSGGRRDAGARGRAAPARQARRNRRCRRLPRLSPRGVHHGHRDRRRRRAIARLNRSVP